ncbi:hypothetical protein [Amycolatopsis thermoflava]|uniref:hypothetical protein n=1 Tax=Amycolatopsis thermoflava TaxID=84480 RepID=UPI003F4A03E3
MPYIWSYGMGAESTAGIVRMLTDRAARPDTIAADFSNLVVVIAQTGDEWSTTGDLVQHYVLPLLRKNNVRLVEVARKGPTKKDGVAVLQDTRHPYRLHLDGVYKLSRENRVTGTMPQLGGVRKCSQKAKGAPQDAWRANEFGDRPYIHAIGFNVHEGTRVTRDSAYSMGGQRIPTYPIYEWGWSRQDCLDYLYRKLGVAWPKKLLPTLSLRWQQIRLARATRTVRRAPNRSGTAHHRRVRLSGAQPSIRPVRARQVTDYPTAP